MCSLAVLFLVSNLSLKCLCSEGNLRFSSFAKVNCALEKTQTEMPNYQDICCENQRFSSLFLKVKDIICNSNNQSISYYSNNAFINELTLIITQFIAGKKEQESLLEDIRYIFDNFDYRTVGIYINALISDNKAVLKAIRSHSDPLLDYHISQFNKTKKVKSSKNINLVQKYKLPELFAENHPGCYFYAKNTSGAKIIKELYCDSSGNIIDYIEQQMDLPGMFSLVRRGLVKKIPLKNGNYVVSKRNNPEKPGRFQNEQETISKISRRIGFGKNKKIKYKDFAIAMIAPIAIVAIPQADRYYSIMDYQKGKTLEEVLLAEKNRDKRVQHFKNLRKILNILYDNGIVWTDMAPRNIIVENANSSYPIYYILDFEKSKVLEHPATELDKAEHLRGPVCVEEFGAICSLEEIKQIFDFDPEKWNFNSKAPVPFVKPKRELVSIFKGRGKKCFNFGEYNKLEKKVINVRLPINKGEKTLYPLHCSFEVDHYLGEDYDRKLTEIFLSSVNFGLFGETIELFESLLQNLNNKTLVSEFISFCCEDSLDLAVNKAKIELKAAIDELYKNKEKNSVFTKSLNKFAIKQAMLSNYTNNFFITNGLTVCKGNFSLLRGKIFDLIKSIKYQGDVENVFLSGGFGRGEISPSSDIDIAILDQNNISLRRSISNKLHNNLELDAEFYPFSKRNFEKFVFKNPQFFIDVLCGKLVYLKSSAPDRVSKLRTALLQNKNYLVKVLDFYLKNIAQKEEVSKLLLESINLVLCLSQNDNKMSKDNEALIYYKSILLSNKLYTYYHSNNLFLYQSQLKRIKDDVLNVLNNYKQRLVSKS